jgi:hypothetical protein
VQRAAEKAKGRFVGRRKGRLSRQPPRPSNYKTRLYALAKRRLIRGITTAEIMEMSRGESAVYKPKKK